MGGANPGGGRDGQKTPADSRGARAQNHDLDRPAFQHIVTAASSVISTSDLDGTITYVNPAFLVQWGYSTEVEVVGRPFTEFWVLGSDHPENMRKLGETGSWTGLVRGRRRDGSIFEMLSSANLVKNDTGEPVAMMCVSVCLEDSTGGKLASQQQAAILEATTDMVGTADTEGNIIYVNQAGRELLGWEEGAEYHISDAHPDWAADIIFNQAMPAAMRTGSWLGETALISAGGEVIPVSHLVLAHRNVEGDVEYFSTIMRDITSLKRFEEEHKEHIDFLEHLERVDDVLRQATDIDPMLDSALRTVLEIIGADRAWLLYPCDPTADTLVVPIEVTRPEYPGASALNLEIPVTDALRQGIINSLSSKEPVAYGPGEVQQVSGDNAGRFQVQAELHTVLHVKTGRPWLFGLHQCSYPRKWSPGDIELFREISRRLTDGLDRMLIQQDLEAAKQRFEIAARCASDLIYEWDILSDVLTWYGDVDRVLGYDPGELDRSRDMMFAMIHPEDQPRMEREVDYYLRTGDPLYCEYRIKHKDGSWRYWKDRGLVLMGADGKAVRLIGVCTDITKRRLAEGELIKREERYRLLAENVSDIIWTTDIAGNMTYVSPSVERLLGVPPEVAMDGTIFDSLTEESKEYAKEVFRAELENDRLPGSDPNRIRIVEVEEYRHDGSLISVEATVKFLRNEKGEPVGILGVTRDITERKKAEEERRLLELQVRQTQKLEALGTLAGGIAHDFNNILFAIMGNAEIAMDEAPQGSEIMDCLEGIYSAGQRAAGLVQQILSFARQAEAKQQPLNAGMIVKEVLKLVRSTIPANIEIRQQVDTDETSILGDATQLHQVLLNLCTNAHHAMLDTGGLLDVTLTRRRIERERPALTSRIKPGEYVVLTVSDTGTGMGQDVLERIFEPFFTTKEGGRGSGLGLSVVHGIVAGMDGVIDVRSRPGLGTEFHVYLPAVADAVFESEPEEQAELPRGTERILLIDDEPQLLKVVESILRTLGYTVSGYTSSVEALTVFLKSPGSFDLVVTDQAMPGLTGDELVEQLLQLRPDLPVIMCTGFSQVVDADGAQRAGIRKYLNKPLTRRELATAVREVLDGE